MPDVDLTDWAFIIKGKPYCKHLWKQEHSSMYDVWATVMNDEGWWDYRECVLCDAKQIKDPDS